MIFYTVAISSYDRNSDRRITLEKLKTRKKELQDTLANAEISEKDTSKFMAMIEKYTDMQKLDSAIAHELIDHIYIGERVKCNATN